MRYVIVKVQTAKCITFRYLIGVSVPTGRHSDEPGWQRCEDPRLRETKKARKLLRQHKYMSAVVVNVSESDMGVF